ncbi:hypothetical protein L484_009446 [Morus notabilis]|uniref:Uncharacterized protein n=1 Tax=Morus notabilis TaxID=981085 RepID=W9S771_9ROSA|nr:hypothetical protein L484_009446 [Morus notabilis]
MPTDMKNLLNNNSLAFTLWSNKMKKAQTQDDGLARALMQKKIAKKVTSSAESNKRNNSSEKIMAGRTKSDHITSSKKACICAPTNHTGSFRCHLHRTKNIMSCTSQQDRDGDDKKSNGRETNSVRTIGDGQPMLSRFGRAACKNMPLTTGCLASSKPEKVK